MSKLNSLLFEKLFYNDKLDFLSENLNFANQTRVSQFETLMNVITPKLSEDEIVKEILTFLNYILKNLSLEEFDGISNKYLNKLNDLYKDLMNKLKAFKDDRTIEIILSNIEMVNINFANLFNFFHKNFQNYNEKHKTLMKLIPNGLKIYFKLFEDTFTTTADNSIQFNQFMSIFLSFSSNVIVLINNFPTMIRTFESRLDNIYRYVLTELVTSNLINDKKLVDAVCLTFSLLIRLSPDISTKLSLYLNKLMENIKYYKALFEPRTIKTIKARPKVSIEDKKNIFKFKESFIAKLKTPSINICNNILDLLFKIVKLTFKSIPKNSMVEINLNNLINLISENLEGMISNHELLSINETDYIVEGLQLEEFKLFKEYYALLNFKLYRFLIKNYSEYLYYYIPSIKSLVSKIILNFDKYYTKHYENYLEVFKFFKFLFRFFDSRLYSSLQEIVIKILMNNFVDIYVLFLERNDKTVVKVDTSYFKLAKVKSNAYAGNPNKKGKKGVSLIQMAKQETYNEKLEIYSNSEIEGILISYLQVFISFFQSDCFRLALLNNENKSLLKSLLDVLVLPPYAKFIFSISKEVKVNIGDFIYHFLKNSCNSLDSSAVNEKYDKLITFLKAFYSNDDLIASKIFGVYDKMRRKKQIFRKEDNGNDITSNFIDINRKIADKLKSNSEKIIKMIESNGGEERNVENNIESINNLQPKININGESSFKIEYSVNLKEDDNEYKNIHNFAEERNSVSKKKKRSNNDEDEYLEYMSAKKSKTENITSEEPSQNVNKIFKSKWTQVKNSEQEFTSKDGIYLKIKNPEEFLKAEEKTSSLNNIEITAEKQIKMIVEEEEIDSDSDIEIPDIF